MKRSIERRVRGRAIDGLTFAVAHADNCRRRTRGEEILDGEQPSKRGRVGASRNHDGGVWSDSACLFCVQIGFPIGRIGPRVRAGVASRWMGCHHRTRVFAEELVAICRDIRAECIAVLDHHDRLPRAVEPQAEKGIQVVNHLEFGW